MVLPESLPVRKPFERQASLNPVLPLIESRDSSTLRWLSLVTFLTALPESGVAEIALLYLDDALALEGEAAREFASAYYALTGVGLLMSQTVFLRYLPRLVDGPIAMLLVSAVSNMLHMLVCVPSFFFFFLIYENNERAHAPAQVHVGGRVPRQAARVFQHCHHLGECPLFFCYI